MRRCAFIGFIAWATVVISSWVAHADSPGERETLTGLKSVYVLVTVSQYLMESGLSDAALRADAERGLRSAGIRVATETELPALPGSPVLGVVVNGGLVQSTTGQELGYIANVEVALHQLARLEQNSSIRSIAVTWSVEKIVISPSAEAVHQAVHDLTAQFVNAYLAVNPK